MKPAFFVIVMAAFVPYLAHAFETCTVENSYLEAQLPSPGETIDVNLPQACVEASHRSLAATGYYGFCPTLEGMPARTQPRPCVSAKYVGAVHSTLIDVCDCFDFDPRLAFATFNLESAMHMNAVGAATDVGVGQLTKSAIEEVTLNALGKARKMATASPKASCQRLLPYMTPHDSAKENRCGFMALPENPSRNLIYSILLIQQNRKSIEKYWAKLQIALPPGVNSELVKQHLTMLAYNSGSAGAVATLKAYADQLGSRVTERLLNFESTDYFSFVNYMARFFPVVPGKESTRKRISKYVKYIVQAGRRVEKLATMSCFDPGTFPVLDTSSPVTLGARPLPDFTLAPGLVAQNLQILAKGESAGETSCAARRAKFKLDFLPRGLGLRHLPPALQDTYMRLCN